MSSTKPYSRYRNPNTKARSPSPRSRPRDWFSGSKRSEPERLSRAEERRQYEKSSNHEDDDRELCMKKLSEFNESLRRQGQSTSTKFQWNHLLHDNTAEPPPAVASKPELAMLNERTATTYSMNLIGIGLTKENQFIDSRQPHLKDIKSGCEDFRYPDVGNRGMIDEAVGFGGHGENLGFDSSCVISEMARNRIRRIEEVTELAYRKMESARVSAIDSIIDKIDGAVENKAFELNQRVSLPQQYTTEEKVELVHGKRNQQREDCSHHALTQSQNGAVFVGGSRQFQNYVHLSEKSHEMEQENEDFGSRMNCHQTPKRAPLHGERQESPEDYGHYLPRDYVDFGRESHVKERTNDVSSSWMNRPQARKRALLDGERQELSEDYYGHSLLQHSLDFNIEPHEAQQENELLNSRMNHLHKPKEAPLHGEKQQMQEDCSHLLPQHHLGLSGKSHVMEQETGIRASRLSYPQYQKEYFFHGESQQLQKDCALESYPLPKQDDDVCTTEGSTRQISATEALSINSESSKTRAKKRIIDLRKIRESRINTLTRTFDYEILDTGYVAEQWSDEDFEQLLLLRNSGFERPRDERTILFDELPSQRNIIHCDCQVSSTHTREFAEHSNRKNKQGLGLPYQVRNPILSNRKSIKQRLGPHCQVHPNRRNINQQLGPPCQIHSTRRNIKQRLGPPFQVHNPNGIPRIERHKTRKLLEENVNDFYEGVQARDVDPPDVKRGRTVPPEHSKEFKQLIHDAFVKFVKALNENPAQRRKYTEKGEAETLKCCVCGSKSKEFVNTPSLVMHAFTSPTVQHRVDHLGLHKALCVLMGWDSMAASNSLWVQKTLPDAEALAMKDDLVVWPPVVILHNSSIATTNSDDRIIVSIEELEAFLREMGFYRGISKVCRGKPANQSIMIVIFHGTFSGLQEAERLHKLYAENKHGRAEFQQVNCSSRETWKASPDKVEDVLYGYLAIAGDLDKLDFETKSRSVVKSKKEIYAIADAFLDTE
ncbi:hypothetical protein REPUB_Repub11eG0138400 [Reevesia pubescens]